MNPRPHRTALYLALLFVILFSSVGGALAAPVAAQAAPPAAALAAQTCTDVSLTVAEDTHMRSGSSRQAYNYGGATLLRLNPYYSSGGTDDQFTGALLRWNLSSAGIPTNATITAASIVFYVTNASNNAYSLYNMRRTWTEGSNDGASGSGASWNFYGAGTGSWGTTGAQNTTSDRYDTNLWGATASQFNTTGSVTFALNASGLAVVQGWTAGTLSNYGLTIQNYSGTATDIWEAASSENTTTANRPKLNLTYCVSTDPTITVTGTLSAFSALAGTPSAAQTYTVAGAYLTDALNISAPAGFEISSNGTTYSTSLALTPSSGTVATTTIYVRLNSASTGAFSGNIAHTSTGATQVNVAASGTVSSCITTSLVSAADLYMSGTNTTYNYGAQTYMRVTLSTSNPRGSLLRWDLSSVPTTAMVTAASLTLYVSTAQSTAAYNLYNMRRTWVEGTGTGSATGDGATWQTYNGSSTWGTNGAANTSTDRYDTNLWGATASTFSSTGSKEVTLNAAGLAAVQGWVATPASNYGVTIQNYGTSATEYDVQFATNNNATVANRPKLNLTYCAVTGPTIITSGALSAFSTMAGSPSAAQTYSVQGMNLTGAVTINAPSGFQISTDGSTYSSSLSLTPASGTLAATTIYVRLYSAGTGSFSGSITHTSAGATQVDIAVSGTVTNCTTTALTPAADTYISNYSTSTTNNYGATNLFKVTLSTSNPRGALLRWNLSSIPSNATVSSASMTLYVSTSAAATYSLYNMRRAWVEGTGDSEVSGDGATWLTYDGANAWGTSGAANTSSDRYTTNLWGAGSTTFNSTGSKTVSLNTDGVAAVQGWITSPATNYGVTIQNYGTSSTEYDLQVSSKENTTTANWPKLNVTYCVPTGPSITTAGTLNAFASTINVASAEQSYSVAGTNLTEPIVVTAPSDFQISLTSGSGFGTTLSLPQTGGTVAATTIYVRFLRASLGTSTGSITHSSAGATTANVAVSGTATNGAPTITLAAPADNATNVAMPPTLQATVTDPENDALTVSFYGRAVGAGTGSDFRLVVIPDTQNEVTSYPAVLTSQFTWIANNKTAQSMAFVTSVGDIVNTSSSTTEYERADAAYDLLDAADVWYSVSPGNHDLGGLYNTYFGPSRFAGKSYYQGPMTAGDNLNNYSFFSAGGMDFIIINLTYSPSATVLDWADALLKANTNRRGIVVQHDILNVDNSWNNQASYTALRDNPNLFLMLCGHMHTSSDGSAYVAGSTTSTPSQTIHVLLTDYQEGTSGGNGYLRLLRFSPSEDLIHATIYSPYTGGSLTSSSNYEQFDMAYDMASSDPFALIGTVSASGGTASLSWSGRAANTEYEWYATVSDGASTTTSAANFSFTTGAETPVTYALSVTPGGSGSGTVTSSPAGIDCGATCSASFNQGTAVQLTATPASGSTFTGWGGACSGTGACSVTMDAAKSVTAQFALNTYALTVTKSGNGSGTVTSDTGGINCGSTCSATFNHGAAVVLTAVADTGSTFTGWTGDCSGTGTCSVSMTAAKNVTATFTKLQFALNVTASPAAGGVTSPAGTANYDYGTVVNVTAQANTGYTFSGWGGACSGTGACSVTMDGPQSVTANFTLNQYALTIAIDPAGAGTTNPVAGSHSYDHGAVVAVTATPATGYTFSGWTGDCTGSTCSVTMTGAKSVTAHFTLNTYALNVNKQGTGSGAVTSDVAGINCGSDCSEIYSHGAAVVLTATPDASSTFTGWSGGVCSGTGTCSVTMDAAKSVIATFTLKQYTLNYAPGTGGALTGAVAQTVNHGGSGTAVEAIPNAGYHFVAWSDGVLTASRTDSNVIANVSVTANFAINTYTLHYAASANGTISGSASQTVNYGANGSAVEAIPNAGYHFVAWSDGVLTASRTDSNVSANLDVTANFAINTYTLHYAAGAHGSLTGSATQIVDYGSDGTAVTAVPETGYHFTGWSDGVLTASRTDSNVTANLDVTANFAINTYALDVSKQGNGSGTVTSAPAGIACGGDCSETYDYNTAVVLTAAPDASSTFTGWSGGVCSGSGTCSVTMDAAKSVIATFTLKQYTLSISADPSAGGTTSPALGSHIYNHGAVVPVSATPADGYAFSGWTGDCTGSTCSVTMDGDKSVVAHFTQNVYVLTVAVEPAGAGTTEPAAGSHNYAHGAQVDMTATPTTGYLFDHWSGDCTGSSACQITMSAAKSVTAHFTLKTYTLAYAAGAGGTLTGSASQTVSHGGSGTPVEAVPNSGYHFVKWSDDTTANPRTDGNVTADLSVTADFALNQYALTVTKAGNGSGTVTSDTGGINCGSTCSATFNHGAAVVLTAAADTGSTFTGWTGDCSGTGTCSVTMTAAKNVTATFAKIQYALTVTADPVAGGTTSPAGTANYDYGTVVNVTAQANTGYTFSGWGGACSGTGACSVTMDGPQSVTANFTLNQYALNYAAGVGGTIEGSAAQTVSHGGSGSAVTAVANTGYHFTGWSDGVTTAARTDNNITGDLGVTANFALNQYTLTLAADPAAGGTTSPAAGDLTYNHGDVVNVTATPATGYLFSGWTGACSNSISPCSVTMDDNKTLTAHFALINVGNAVLSLNDVAGEPNAVVTVLLSATGLQGLRGADIVIHFDPAVLTVQSPARKGALINSAAWMLADYVPTPGELRLSFGAPTGVSGSGTLVEFDIQLIGARGASSVLDFVSAVLNDGAIVATLDDGSATVNPFLGVSGAVAYWSGSRAVPGALLTLDGAQDYTAQSDAAGAYTLGSVAPGNYALSPSYNGAVGDHTITSFDASAVLRHMVGSATLTGPAAIAADVNKYNGISAIDASDILAFAAGLTQLPFAGAGHIWEFTPAGYTYTGLSSNLANQNFTLILLGDVSGNWTPSATAAATRATAASLTLIPGESEADGTRTVIVQLNPGTQEGAYSLEFEVAFDGAAYRALEPRTNGDWLAAANSNTAGKLRVAAASALPVTVPTPVLTLRFKPLAAPTNPVLTITAVSVDEAASTGVVDPYRVRLPIVQTR